MSEEKKETTGVTEPKPEEKTYSEKEWRGLLSDKQRETQIRQELEAKLQSKDNDIALLKSELENIKLRIDSKDDDIASGDPDDYATMKHLKEAYSKLKKELDNTKKELIDSYTKYETEKTMADKNKRDEQSVTKAREKYTEEKAGKGLSFDDVLEGTRRMVERNPAYKMLIANDPDPGEMMYNIGLQDPTIAKRVEAYKKQMPSAGITSKEGLEGTTAPAGYFSQAYVQKMAKEPGWIKKNLQAIHESQKQWSKEDVNR